MLFNSYTFVLVFLPAAILGFFYLSRAGEQAGRLWLVGVSFVFYGWWDPRFLPILIGSIAVNHVFWRVIAGSRGRIQVAAVTVGIACNLMLLMYFKYAAAWLSVFSIAIDTPSLPLGISFFTFTQIGLLIDARAGCASQPALASHALFVSFFPHLIAGPVLQHQEIMPQFSSGRIFRPSAENISAGLMIFFIGLLKKTLLADPLAPAVASGFADPAGLTLVAAWQTALSYSLQLYFDFSGYSDMAIGAARMLNIRFPANFNSPYKAQSVIDYWQRWHITLTRYLTIYVYNPLSVWLTRRRVARGGAINRRARASLSGFTNLVALPTVVTISLAGIWHGSGLVFLVFGLMHAVYLIVNHAWRLRHGVRAANGRAAVVARVALTYACVLAGSVVFRAPSLGAAGEVFAGMLGSHGVAVALPDLRQGLEILQIAALYAIVWLAPNTQQIMRACEPVLGAASIPRSRLAWRPNLPWAAALGGAACLGLLSLGGSSEFLYFRF